jgi:hypothetical protein
MPRLRRHADTRELHRRPHHSSSLGWAELAGEPSAVMPALQPRARCVAGWSSHRPEARPQTHVRQRRSWIASTSRRHMPPGKFFFWTRKHPYVTRGEMFCRRLVTAWRYPGSSICQLARWSTAGPRRRVPRGAAPMRRRLCRRRNHADATLNRLEIGLPRCAVQGAILVHHADFLEDRWLPSC